MRSGVRLGVVQECVCFCVCVCAECSCLLNPLGSLPVTAHSAPWHPGGRAGQRVPTQPPIERRRDGHNVSGRLAASTARPFLPLWPEINHKYPHVPTLYWLIPIKHQVAPNNEGHFHFLAGIHTQVKTSLWTNTDAFYAIELQCCIKWRPRFCWFWYHWIVMEPALKD